MVDSKKSTRVNIIRSVQTPLGFFALVSLLVEASLGGLVFSLTDVIQQYALFGMLGTLILLIVVVSIISYKHPESLVVDGIAKAIEQGKIEADDRTFKFFENQSDGNDYIKALIKVKPSFSKATIIQYSSNQIHEIVYALLNANIHVDIFLHDPDSAISELQRKKIDIQIREYHDIYKDSQDVCNTLLKVFLYKDIGTIRAIKLDDEILMLGYYTYVNGSIIGHDNPVFMCRSSSDKGHTLFNKYNAYLDRLKTYSEEIDICKYSECA
jgi:hypothetical protein